MMHYVGLFLVKKIKLTSKAQYLKLYKLGLLDPTYIKLNDISYKALCHEFEGEEREYYPQFPCYESRRCGWLVKQLQLSDNTTIEIKSKGDIKKRVLSVMRTNNWITAKYYAILVALDKYSGQTFSRNF